MFNKDNLIKHKNTIINILITIIYAIITFLFVLHHEIWADEAQVWQIARHIQFFDLFKHLVNEGHPSLFYLLMMPFAKLGLPIFFMQVFCWLAMVGSVFLLLKHSPFNGFTKFAIITSGGFLYYFPVIARSYSILPILVFLVAILYKKQKEHPILYACTLAAIANTHVIMFAFVFILGCFFVYDNLIKEKLTNKPNLITAGIVGLSLLAVIIQLCGTEASNGSIDYNLKNIYSSCVRVFVQFFSNSVDYFSSMQLSMKVMPDYATIYFGSSIILAILFFILLFLIFFKNKKIFCLAFLSIGFQLAIYIFAYSNMIYPNRNFCAFLILIFSYWIILENEVFIEKTKLISKKIINTILAIFFLFTIANGINLGIKDWKYNYSSGKETAEFIKKNIDENAVIIPTLDAFGLTIYAYADKHNFHSVATHKNIKYNVWLKNDYYFAENFGKIFTNIVNDEIKNNKFENKEIYILAPIFLIDKNFFEKYKPEKYKTIYQSKPCLATGESFTIYHYQQDERE